MLEEWRASRVGSTDDWETVTLPGSPSTLAGAETVRYETDLADPREPPDDVAVLHLRGCYARTTVEVPGTVLGGDGPIEGDVYFAALRIPFRPAADGRITVTCEAPADRFGGLHDTDEVPAEEAVPGVWWTADLETHSLPYVDTVAVRPEPTDDGATLHVRTTVVADGPLDDRLTYSLRPAGDAQTRGTMDRRPIATDGPGPTTVEHEIDVHDPARWHPRGHGTQDRYVLRAKLGDSERSVTTGIAAVDRDGSDLRVNGERVPIRGVTLETAEPADVRRAVECNANLVRAHAQVLPPAVYDACDEAGLLVWQDLPLTGPGAFDVDRGRELVDATAAAYGRHPSLAAIAVHDRPTDAFANGLGAGRLDRLRRRWRAWRTDYDSSDAERVAEAVPATVAAFPVVGDPGVETDARRLFAGWDYDSADDAGALLDRYPADVVAAFGAGALGTGEATETSGFDDPKLAARVEGGREESRAYQAAVVESVAETLRRRGVGAIASALRDAGNGGLGVYARDGEAKPGKDALAGAFEPVQAFLAAPTAGTTDVVVANDGARGASGELSWAAGDAGGTFDVAVDAGGRWTGGPISIPGDADGVELRLDLGDRTVHNVYERS